MNKLAFQVHRDIHMKKGNRKWLYREGTICVIMDGNKSLLDRITTFVIILENLMITKLNSFHLALVA